jgi:succinate-semialdehyde dehydrogenase/glutarate-semialdehyde dehydrogenase
VGALKVGPATDPDSQIGPMINARAVDKIERHVRDAVSRGARIAVGGERLRSARCDGPNYYAPTVLVNADASMECSCEETFGPVVPVTRFETEAEVIAPPTTRPSASPPTSIRPTCAASGAWPRRSNRASSASTKARWPPKRRPSAA